MFTIGEFSRLCMVTTKTLDVYKRQGLRLAALCSPRRSAAYVDRFACDWHRLSTTGADPFPLVFDYNAGRSK